MLFNTSEMAPHFALLLQVAELLAIAYVLIRYIFEPRLETFLDRRIKVVHSELQSTLSNLEVRMAAQESDARLSAQALTTLTQNVSRVTVVMERIEREMVDQGKSLSYIEGELRGKTLRNSQEGDIHAHRRAD
jgi:hypothetical protein